MLTRQASFLGLENYFGRSTAYEIGDGGRTEEQVRSRRTGERKEVDLSESSGTRVDRRE